MVANRQATCDQAPMSPIQAAKFLVRSSSVSSLDKSEATPTTSPMGPTSSATSMATSPTPEPISRTRCPLGYTRISE
jgi:hypothetical protein